MASLALTVALKVTVFFTNFTCQDSSITKKKGTAVGVGNLQHLLDWSMHWNRREYFQRFSAGVLGSDTKTFAFI